MSRRITVKPVGGALVRFEDAARGDIPADGATVPASAYYRRRIAEGSLVEARRKPSPPKPNEDV